MYKENRLLTEYKLFSKTSRTETGCLVSGRSPVNQYGRSQMRVDGKMEYLPRVAWKLYRGEIPDGIKVLHSCDNPACIEIKHLFLGTQKENMLDMAQKGRKCLINFFPEQKGESHPNAKLYESDIVVIRADARPAWQIALSFNVSKTQVARIKRRESWGHV